MGRQQRQPRESVSAEGLGAPAGGAPKDTERAAREWWWAGRLLALHHFPVEYCPYRTPGPARRRWLAGFASGTRTVARGSAPPA